MANTKNASHHYVMQSYEDWRAILDELSMQGMASTEQEKLRLTLKDYTHSVLKYLDLLAGKGKSWLKFPKQDLQVTSASSPRRRTLTQGNLTLTATRLVAQLSSFEQLMSSSIRLANSNADRTLNLINDAARTLCLAVLTCPAHWIDQYPHEVVIWEADRQDPFTPDWRSFLKISTEELEWLRDKRESLIHLIDEAQYHTGDQPQKPILSHFMAIFEHINSHSPFVEPRKNRYRNTKKQEPRYRDKLNAVIRQHPECQVVTPLFGINAPELSADAQRELLTATWDHFTKFRKSRGRRKMGPYRRTSNLLYEHLVWYLFKEHWFPLTGHNGPQLTTYISAMLFFQRGTFSTRLHWRNTQFRDGRKINPMPDYEVLVELKELWHIALINAKHEAKQNHPEWQDNAIRSFVCSPRADEHHNYLSELPTPRLRNEGIRFIESLSPDTRKTLIAKLKLHLKSLIFRDQALMLTPLSTQDVSSKGLQRISKRTIGCMENAHNPKPLGRLNDGTEAYWHPPSAQPPAPWMIPVADGTSSYTPHSTPQRPTIRLLSHKGAND